VLGRGFFFFFFFKFCLKIIVLFYSFSMKSTHKMEREAFKSQQMKQKLSNECQFFNFNF
jgi:hypothetical protein